MLEVFKTDIENSADALFIQQQLYRYFPDCRIVFDLEDCDRILKISGGHFVADKVQNLVRANGFACEVLD
ncbi:MAG: hypothetical protein EOO48_14485 [Flavobacterium sp.]|nr:MAG: hypothetical protein EOO48_14485 [Flavobacterium sp.]